LFSPKKNQVEPARRFSGEIVMSFNTGETVGPYRVLEQLGQGGMATVYKAYHASLDRYVAIKVLHQAFLEDPNFLARFQREARLVAKLEHPNIVPIYDYAEHEGRPYLVMKFIEGETLKARLQRGPLTPAEVERIFEQVGAGLAYAHKQGILHRDIKPSNVILAKDGGIFLADFGLARIAQAGESTLTSDMVLGTPQYISPEQALGKNNLDEGTDIYSLGVMLYEMTTGRVPFSADTPFSVIHDHIYTPLPLPTDVNPNLSAEIERILLKALSKERADRYPDVPAFVTAFKEAWSENAPTQAAPKTIPASETSTLPPASSATLKAPAAAPQISDTPAPAAPRSKPSRWWWLALPAVLLLCCAVVVVGSVINKNRSAARQANSTQAPLTLPDGNAIATQVAATVAAALPVKPNQPGEPFPPQQPGQPEPLTPQPQLPGDGAQPIISIELPPLSVDEAQKIVDLNPQDPKAHFALGYALLQDDQVEQGYGELSAAAEMAKKQPGLLIGMGLALEQQEEWLGALLFYARAAKTGRDIRPAQAIDRLHEAVFRAYEYQEAPMIVPFEMLADVEPLSALIAHARYEIFFGSLEKAQQWVDNIQQVAPGSTESSMLQAEIFLEQDNAEAAMPLLQSVMDSPSPAWMKSEAEAMMP